jgi:hypothetical protein
MYSIQLYVIKFVSGFLPGTQVSSTNKTDHHDITEILLKVALNTISIFSLFLSKNCVQKIFYEILVCTIFYGSFSKHFTKSSHWRKHQFYSWNNDIFVVVSWLTWLLPVKAVIWSSVSFIHGIILNIIWVIKIIVFYFIINIVICTLLSFYLKKIFSISFYFNKKNLTHL